MISIAYLKNPHAKSPSIFILVYLFETLRLSVICFSWLRWILEAPENSVKFGIRFDENFPRLASIERSDNAGRFKLINEPRGA